VNTAFKDKAKESVQYFKMEHVSKILITIQTETIILHGLNKNFIYNNYLSVLCKTIRDICSTFDKSFSESLTPTDHNFHTNKNKMHVTF
jgi:2-iminoacetate synthase ThiH